MTQSLYDYCSSCGMTALLEQCVEGEDLVNEHVAAGAGAEA